ncbi:hypothetical protein JHK82_046980 [Glycine max]|nr:hypothetical protein JHK82_046980 [Glycine max]
MEAPDNSEATVPYNSPKLAGTVNWGTATVVGVFAGMLYGGSKEAAASVSKDAEVMLKLGSTEDKREQYRLMRDAMEKRFIRVTRGSIVGGVRLGIFTAAFYCLQNLLAEKRGVHDVFNVVGAGSATASAFGWIHLKLVEMANEGNPAAHPHSDQRQVKSGVSAAIERLEGNLIRVNLSRQSKPGILEKLKSMEELIGLLNLLSMEERCRLIASSLAHSSLVMTSENITEEIRVRGITGSSF